MTLIAGAFAHPDVQHLASVFRYFDEERNADALCAGEVWITTLQRCRAHERLASRDEMDGCRDYEAGLIAGSSDDPLNAPRLERLGFTATIKDSIIVGAEVRQVYPDAFVLCSTTRQDAAGHDGFGRFGVEISRPVEFFAFLRQVIASRHEVEGVFRMVTYAEPRYQGLDEEPGPLPFTKRPDRWAREREARMLFTPLTSTKVVPQSFLERALGRYCRRVDFV